MKYEFLIWLLFDYNVKKENGLKDGIKGYKDFNINWIGWYEKNVEFIIDCNNIDFNMLEF